MMPETTCRSGLGQVARFRASFTAYAQDLSVFLNESELTERRAFIESFVKEIVVMPGNAVV